MIGYTPEIGKALKRILAETPQTDTGKLAYKKGKKQQLFQGRKRTLAGNFEYNGYFKIIDASEYDEEGNVTAYKVKVVDGATYNPETGSSGTNPAYINGQYIAIPAWTSEAFTGDVTYVRVHIMLDDNRVRTAVMELSDTVAPSDTFDDLYRDLGRVFIKDGVLTILQELYHSLRFDLFGVCE